MRLSVLDQSNACSGRPESAEIRATPSSCRHGDDLRENPESWMSTFVDGYPLGIGHTHVVDTLEDSGVERLLESLNKAYR